MANQAAALIDCPFVAVLEDSSGGTGFVQIVAHGAYHQIDRFSASEIEEIADRIVRMTEASFHCAHCGIRAKRIFARDVGEGSKWYAGSR
jgi:hypothetical protein